MQYLVFDIGNVLCNVDLKSYTNALALQFNISEEEAFDFLKAIQKPQDLGITNMSMELKKYFNIKSNTLVSKLLDEWNKVVEPNYIIYFFEYLIREKNLKVALLSNIGTDHADYLGKTRLNNTYLWSKSIHYFSCNEGLRKPNYSYYKMFLEQYPDFNGALYLDDLQENIDMGNKIGFKSIQFDITVKESVLNDKKKIVEKLLKG